MYRPIGAIGCIQVYVWLNVLLNCYSIFYCIFLHFIPNVINHITPVEYSLFLRFVLLYRHCSSIRPINRPLRELLIERYTQRRRYTHFSFNSFWGLRRP